MYWRLLKKTGPSRKHPAGFKGQGLRALSDLLFKSHNGKDDIKGTSTLIMFTFL